MILDEEMSFRVRGVLIEVSKRYGATHKERVYHEACREAFQRMGLRHVSEQRIAIHSLDTGKIIATHVPDFVIEDRLVVELKAVPWLPPAAIRQLEQYLRATIYEVGFLVNFGTPMAQIVRRIYTNDRKPWFSHLTESQRDGIRDP